MNTCNDIDGAVFPYKRHFTHRYQKKRNYVCFICAGSFDGYSRGRNPKFCYACKPKYVAAQGRAGAAVSKAVRLGQLPKASTLQCADCKAPANSYDHRSYDEPLKVEPVCNRCNQTRGPATWKAA